MQGLEKEQIVETGDNMTAADIASGQNATNATTANICYNFANNDNNRSYNLR